MPPEAPVLENEAPSQRRDSNTRQAPPGPVIEVIEDQQQGSGGPSIEEALAASRRATEQAETAQRAAQDRERQANAEMHRLRQGQVQDQGAVLASAVEASTAERDRHAHAWQTAMEAGDFGAAAKHQSDMMLATSKLDRASGELAILKTAGQGQPQRQQQGQPQQQAGSVSQASQNWITAHKEFNKHRDALILKHQELVNDGVTVDGPRYFRELDAEYDRLTAGGGDQGGQREMDRGRQFDGAPPSRGGGGSSGDGNSGRNGTVQTLLGPVGVRTTNGQTFLSIPAHLRADFAEGAKVVGMSVEEYAMDQVNIARDQAAGGTGGMITAEGRKFR